ncbi:hypothetical protein CFC21_006140 [Triticum aestivum]|uniref:Uncharacterized protein n=2 Tax=Triticum aestivum TaxID=4565 RepID=A0A3B5YUF6_WHEAT|nr:hypothetical protein CFC21_006140 [Triticum aestivum]
MSSAPPSWTSQSAARSTRTLIACAREGHSSTTSWPTRPPSWGSSMGGSDRSWRFRRGGGAGKGEASNARARVLAWLQEATGLATLFNMVTWGWLDADVPEDFMNRASIKMVLTVRTNVSWEAYAAVMVTASQVEALLRREGMRMLLYEGVWDLWDGKAWLEEVDWDWMTTLREAERALWRSIATHWRFVHGHPPKLSAADCGLATRCLTCQLHLGTWSWSIGTISAVHPSSLLRQAYRAGGHRP